MDLNSLSGKDLDKYGESQGILRYQGIGLPEDDDSYRKSIRQGLNMDVSVNVKKYGVLIINPDDSSIIRIATDFKGNSMAIYTSQSEALLQASIWKRHNKKFDFEVREIKLFEVPIMREENGL